MRKKKFNFNLWFRRLHKWLALIVGLQLVMWTLSGFMMTTVPIEDVHGDHLRKMGPPPSLEGMVVDFPLLDVMKKFEGQTVQSVILQARLDKAVYKIKLKDRIVLIDAHEGMEIPHVSQQEAIEIASVTYLGTGSFRDTEYVTRYAQYPEIKGRPLPIWKVNFEDDVNTSLYVSLVEARVITARSDIWRQFDFFWMLHIMDYENREDFNSPLLIFAASLGLFVAFSGIILVLYAFSKKDFYWIRPKKKSKRTAPKRSRLY